MAPHAPPFRTQAHTRRRRNRLVAVKSKRGFLVGGGVFLMLAGAAVAPSPVPVGFVLFAMGIYFVARGSKKARRSVKVLRRRVPPLSRGLNRVKHRLPSKLRVFIERSDPDA